LQTCESCKLLKVPASDISQIQITSNTIEAQFILPNLPKGQYHMLVEGKDSKLNRSGNGYNINFRISDSSQPTKLKVYPNPTDRFADLEFEIINSSKPSGGTVWLYDNVGRQVEEILFRPNVGKTDVFINLDRKLTAGLYHLKARIDWSEGNSEVMESKIVIK
jgi:hypothetical protein